MSSSITKIEELNNYKKGTYNRNHRVLMVEIFGTFINKTSTYNRNF